MSSMIPESLVSTLNPELLWGGGYYFVILKFSLCPILVLLSFGFRRSLVFHPTEFGLYCVGKLDGELRR